MFTAGQSAKDRVASNADKAGFASRVANVEDSAVVFVERTFESSKTAAVKFELRLNFLAARDGFCDGNADSVLKYVEILISRQVEKNFGKFVIARNNVFELEVGLKFFNLKGINNGFRKFFHKITSSKKTTNTYS